VEPEATPDESVPDGLVVPEVAEPEADDPEGAVVPDIDAETPDDADPVAEAPDPVDAAPEVCAPDPAACPFAGDVCDVPHPVAEAQTTSAAATVDAMARDEVGEDGIMG